MAEEYSSDSNSESEYVVAVEEWGRQPLRRAGIQEPEIMEVEEGLRPVNEWCSCKHCQLMPTHAQNVCCREHPHASEMVTNNNLQCITDHVGMVELTRPTVLDYNYAMYLNSNHEDLFNPARHDANTKKRFICYRTFVFWLYPKVKRKERVPLPACMYCWVQATFPPTQMEEDFANWRFSHFAYGEEEE